MRPITKTVKHLFDKMTKKYYPFIYLPRFNGDLMAIKLDKLLILNAFKRGKSTYEIAKTAGVKEEVIYNLLSRTKDKINGDTNKPADSPKHEPSLARWERG